MVFKKLLSSLGFGGVEVDTVLASGSAGQPGAPGSTLSGQVHLRAKGDVDITSIQLLLVATGAMGEVELGRFTVAGGLRLGSGAVQAIPFSIALPAHTPFTVLYGQNLPGASVGVRTEVAVAGGSGKTDFDPFRSRRPKCTSTSSTRSARSGAASSATNFAPPDRPSRSTHRYRPGSKSARTSRS
jgi:sporulation-control protein